MVFVTSFSSLPFQPWWTRPSNVSPLESFSRTSPLLKALQVKLHTMLCGPEEVHLLLGVQSGTRGLPDWTIPKRLQRCPVILTKFLWPSGWLLWWSYGHTTWGEQIDHTHTVHIEVSWLSYDSCSSHIWMLKYIQRCLSTFNFLYQNGFSTKMADWNSNPRLWPTGGVARSSKILRSSGPRWNRWPKRTKTISEVPGKLTHLFMDLLWKPCFFFDLETNSDWHFFGSKSCSRPRDMTQFAQRSAAKGEEPEPFRPDLIRGVMFLGRLVFVSIFLGGRYFGFCLFSTSLFLTSFFGRIRLSRCSNILKLDHLGELESKTSNNEDWPWKWRGPKP